MFLFGVLAKRAQFPYSSWLPLAMAAPTPVRSLVHSSTLVTAGIYIVVRYYSHFEENGLILIKFMAFISIFYSGRRALVEIDLKKVVAYSTLSHLRMIIFLASIGSLQASLFHMYTHAIFKRLLFIVVGVILHENETKQDSRTIALLLSSSPLLSALFSSSVISMVGIPFIRGYFSKEIGVHASFEDFNSSWNVCGLISRVCFSAAYSIRVIFFLGWRSSSPLLAFNLSYKRGKIAESLVLRFFLNMVRGAFLLPIIFPRVPIPLPEAEVKVKLLVVISLALGRVLGWLIFLHMQKVLKWVTPFQIRSAAFNMSVGISWMQLPQKTRLWFPVLERFGVVERTFKFPSLLIKSLTLEVFIKFEKEIIPFVKLLGCLSIIILFLYIRSLYD